MKSCYISLAQKDTPEIATGIKLGAFLDELRLLELLSHFIIKTDNKPSISNELQILI